MNDITVYGFRNGDEFKMTDIHIDIDPAKLAAPCISYPALNDLCKLIASQFAENNWPDWATARIGCTWEPDDYSVGVIGGYAPGEPEFATAQDMEVA